MDCIDPSKLGAIDGFEPWRSPMAANDPGPEGPPGRDVDDPDAGVVATLRPVARLAWR